jgi:hypothetical protein
MRHGSIITAVLTIFFVLAAVQVPVHATQPEQALLNYEIISIDAKSWIITAKDTASGEIVKFRMPPAAFKGKTFAADLSKTKAGQGFSVRGPRNARLSNLVMQLTPARGQSPLKSRRIRPMRRAQGARLAWQIIHVNPDWVVTAKNQRNRKVIKFKVNPQAFIGFRFRANAKGIRKGEGFSLIAPNERAFTSACTLLELKK